LYHLLLSPNILSFKLMTPSSSRDALLDNTGQLY
jgi:hypothetical protein